MPGEDPKQARAFTVGGEPGQGPGPELPQVDFSTFVLSLGTSALYHLGVVAHPETGRKLDSPETELARNTIDTLEMLEEKTRGNLDEQERELVGSLLYELRMRFVEVEKGAPGS